MEDPSMTPAPPPAFPADTPQAPTTDATGTADSGGSSAPPAPPSIPASGQTVTTFDPNAPAPPPAPAPIPPASPAPVAPDSGTAQTVQTQVAQLAGAPNIDVAAVLDQLRALGVDVTVKPAENPVAQLQAENEASSPKCEVCNSVQMSLHMGDASTPAFDGVTYFRCLNCGNAQKYDPEASS